MGIGVGVGWVGDFSLLVKLLDSFSYRPPWEISPQHFTFRLTSQLYP